MLLFNQLKCLLSRVLVSRVAHLIKKEKVHPSSILAVTFTKKAAKEMKGRLTHLLLDTNDVDDFSSDSKSVNNPNEGVKKPTNIGLQNAVVTCTTLHSFCCQIVRKYSPIKDFTLYDTADCLKIVKELLKEVNKGQGPDKIKYLPHEVYPCLSMIKRQMLKRISYTFDDEFYEVANNMLHDYNLALRKNNAYDFDDLILETLNILLRNGEAARAIRSKYKHIFCDEWQDVDKSQYCLLLMLLDSSARKLHFGEDIDNYMSVYKIRDKDIMSPTWRPDDTVTDGGTEGVGVGEGDNCRTFFVVGDSKQTIFSWRGADNKNMNYFTEDIPK
jgi:DNA helicase II / ATP-dependent DNA helicase PcrA